MKAASSRRSTYRHGDLYRALVDAGVELARTGGPDAVVLRQATRQVGVAPNAAYRHFADRLSLLGAVCNAAQATLAEAIEDEWARSNDARELSAAEVARVHLRAVGMGYLRFAREEPGLFRTAFSVPIDLVEATIPDKGGRTGLTPFQLLGRALDEWVAADVLPPDRRPSAEFLAWSAVHGLATLLIDGPLRSVSDTQAAEIGERLLDMVESGLPSARSV